MSTTEEQTEYNWLNTVYNKDARDMSAIPDDSVDLVLTSPPYNVDLDYNSYQDSLSNDEYEQLLSDVYSEVYRILKPQGGRLAVVVSDMSKPPFPATTYTRQVAADVGFEYRREVIWYKKNVEIDTAWGSWLAPSSPAIRDTHEHIYLFYKDEWGKPEYEKVIPKEEFHEMTQSVWEVGCARGNPHPAAFSEQLAERVITFLTYEDEVVVDPFLGSGTTAVVSKRLGRRYAGYEIDDEYVELAEKSLSDDDVES